MAKLSTRPIGVCVRCRRFDSYRRVAGLVLCASCGRREKAKAKTEESPMIRETFHDSPSPEHPVRYRTSSEPDAWLSIPDAVKRLRRVLDIPPAEEDRYDFAAMLRDGQTLPSLFATYSIPNDEATR